MSLSRFCSVLCAVIGTKRIVLQAVSCTILSWALIGCYNHGTVIN